MFVRVAPVAAIGHSYVEQAILGATGFRERIECKLSTVVNGKRLRRSEYFARPCPAHRGAASCAAPRFLHRESRRTRRTSRGSLHRPRESAQGTDCWWIDRTRPTRSALLQPRKLAIRMKSGSFFFRWLFYFTKAD